MSRDSDFRDIKEDAVHDSIAGDLAQLHAFLEVTSSDYRDFSKERAAYRLTRHSAEKDSGQAEPAAKSDVHSSGSETVLPENVQAANVFAVRGATVLPSISSRLAPTAENSGAILSPAPASASSNGPTGVCVYGISGGSGRTTLCANLGHALLLRGETVLLADCDINGMLPLHFGADPFRSGVRRFCPPGQMGAFLHLLGIEQPSASSLRERVLAAAHADTRTIFDIDGSDAAALQDALKMSSVVLVPILPHIHAPILMNRVLSQFEQWLHLNKDLQLLFVLNRYEEGNEKHRAIAQELQQRYAGLLSLHIENSADVREAFAARTTVIDFHAESGAAMQLSALAEWIHTHVPILKSQQSAVSRWREL